MAVLARPEGGGFDKVEDPPQRDRLSSGTGPKTIRFDSFAMRWLDEIHRAGPTDHAAQPTRRPHP